MIAFRIRANGVPAQRGANVAARTGRCSPLAFSMSRLASIAAFLICATSAAADGSFHLIGSPPDTTSPHPAALSGDGSTLFGYAIPSGEENLQSYRWSLATGWQPLDRLQHFDDLTQVECVDDDGDTAVGSAGARNDDGFWDLRPFIWTASNGIVDLTTLGAPEDFVPWAISGDGRVIGGRAGARPALWSEEGGLSVIETPPIRYGSVRAVSTDGLVALGYYEPVIEPGSWEVEHTHWFIWASGEMVFDEEVLDDELHRISLRFLMGLTADGSATFGVGWTSDGAGDENCLVRATELHGVECVAELLEAPTGSFGAAFGITESGTSVVGTYLLASIQDPNPWYGFAWDEVEGLRDIETLLVDEHGLDVGEIGRLLPTAISGDGRVIAGHTYSHPDPSSLWIAILAPACRDGFDQDGDGRVDHPDDPGCSSPDDEDERPELVFENGCGRGFEMAVVPALAIASRRRRRSTR